MKTSDLAGALGISIFLMVSQLQAAPPGFNPNISRDEQRRQEEFLRNQREKIAKEKAEAHFLQDAQIDVVARMYDAISGTPVRGKISYIFLKSGRQNTFAADDLEYHAKIRKFSDIKIIFSSPQYFSLSETIPLAKLHPLEKMEFSKKLLKKADADTGVTIDILFAADSSVLKPEYHDLLRSVKNALDSNPTVSLIIKGYAGREAITDEAAKKISLARGETVRAFLLKEGVNKRQLQVVAMGIGELESEAAREYRAELLLIDMNN